MRFVVVAFFILWSNLGAFAQSEVYGGDTTYYDDYFEDENGNQFYYAEEDDANQVDTENEKYSASVRREVDAKKWKKLKKDKRFVYKKDKPKKKSKPLDLSFLNSGIFKVFLYLFLAAFLIYIIYLFVKNNEFSFKRKRDKETVSYEPWEDVESYTDWEKALRNAIDAGDYRLAVRILYLETLQKLHHHEVIRYREEKTNWHYVQKVFGTTYHDPFKTLTTYFDYIWYGEYQITEEQFKEVHTQFSQFHKQFEL